LLQRRSTLLINQVARAVREEFPGVLIGCRGAVSVAVPDRTLPLESTVVPYVAVDQDAARPIEEHSPAEINRLYHAVLKLWRERHDGNVIVYSYYMGKNNQRSLP